MHIGNHQGNNGRPIMNDRDEWDYGPFKVGDVVECYGLTFDHHRIGMEAEIVFGKAKRQVSHNIVGSVSIICYGVAWEDGGQSFVQEKNLRRRKLPMTGLEDVLSMFDKQSGRIKELA